METKNISNAESALLALLSEESMHPYQIEQEVKHRDMRFWTELSMSSIYKLLRKLEKEGFVTRKNEISPENRLRKLYTISKEGENILANKIEDLLSNPEHTRWQVDLGVYNCNLIPDNKVVESLEKYKNELHNKINGYKDLLGYLKKSNCPTYRYEVAKRPVYLLEAEINWVNSFLKQFSNKA